MFLLWSCRSSDDKLGLDYLVAELPLAFFCRLLFIFFQESCGSGLSYLVSPLFHGGELGVAAYGTYVVGKSTDGDIFRHAVAHALAGIEHP